MDTTASWWDGVELWVTGLPFVPQVALVLAVVVPLAFAVGIAADRVVTVVVGLVALLRGRVK